MRYATIDSCFRTIHITENRARPGHCSAPSGSLTQAVPSSALIAVSGTNGVRPILTTGSLPVAIHQRIVRRARPNSAATSPISRNPGTARWRAGRPGDPQPASSIVPNPAGSDVSFVSLAILRPLVVRLREYRRASSPARPRRLAAPERGLDARQIGRARAANYFSPWFWRRREGKSDHGWGKSTEDPGGLRQDARLPHLPIPAGGRCRVILGSGIEPLGGAGGAKQQGINRGRRDADRLSACHPCAPAGSARVPSAWRSHCDSGAPSIP